MRSLLTLALTVLGTSALAHPGHWSDLAGHDHWIAGAALGFAILLGLRGALKGGQSDPKAETPDPENQEEAAA